MELRLELEGSYHRQECFSANRSIHPKQNFYNRIQQSTGEKVAKAPMTLDQALVKQLQQHLADWSTDGTL